MFLSSLPKTRLQLQLVAIITLYDTNYRLSLNKQKTGRQDIFWPSDSHVERPSVAFICMDEA